MAELGHPLLYCHRHCVVNSWAWATQVNSWRSSHSRHVVRLNRCPRFHKTSGLHLLQQCLTHRLIHIARYRITEMRFLQCSPGNVGNIFAAQCVQLLGNAKLLFQFADTFDEFSCQRFIGFTALLQAADAGQFGQALNAGGGGIFEYVRQHNGIRQAMGRVIVGAEVVGNAVGVAKTGAVRSWPLLPCFYFLSLPHSSRTSLTGKPACEPAGRHPVCDSSVFTVLSHCDT